MLHSKYRHFLLSMAVVCYSGQCKSRSMLHADPCQGGILDSDPDSYADPDRVRC